MVVDIYLHKFLIASKGLAIGSEFSHLVVVIRECDIVSSNVQRHTLIALALVSAYDVLMHVDMRHSVSSSAFDVLRESRHSRIGVAPALAVHDFGLIVCVQVMIDVLCLGG